MTTIVCDSGPLISFSSTCLVNMLSFLTERNAEFIIPTSVEREIIERPLHIKRYAFSAVRLHKSIDDKVLKVVPNDEILTQRIVNAANNIFSVRGKPLRILQVGEAACLAIYKQRNCSALVVDEKTTRLLIEDPELLQDNISEEYGARVFVNDKSLNEFSSITKGIEVLRSSDLATVAAKRGYFDSFGKHEQQAFQAAIDALKLAGCSLSDKEVADYQAIKI